MLALADGDGLLGIIHHQRGGSDELGLQLLLAGGIRAHGADMGAGLDPFPGDEGRPRRGDGDQDVGLPGDGFETGRLEGEARRRYRLAEGIQARLVRVPGQDAGDGAHAERGAKLEKGLPAGPDEPEDRGLRPGEMARGKGARRARPHPRQIIRPHQRHGLTAVRIEEQDDGLMIAPALGGIARPIAAGLQPQHRPAGVETCLDAEDRIGMAHQLAHHRIGSGEAGMGGGEGRTDGRQGVLGRDELAGELFRDEKHGRSRSR